MSTSSIQDQIKVMKHFANGGQVESIEMNTGRDGSEFEITYNPMWNWINFEYRIAQPKIAEGHNPKNLTDEEVGVGFRLLSKEEVAHFNKYSPAPEDGEVEYWSGRSKWSPREQHLGRFGCPRVDQWRTKRPPGYFLPKPKVKVPLTAADIPAVCWIKWPAGHTPEREMLVTEIQDLFIMFANGHCVTFGALAACEANVTYSTDRINWKPCYKEINE